MRPAEKCKAAGLTGLAELVEITRKCRRTLINWSKADPVLFEIVLRGAVATKAINQFKAKEINILPTAKAGGFLLRDGNVLPRECSGLH